MPVIASSAVEALKSIADNEYLWCHSMAATPYRLLNGLLELAADRQGLTLMQLHTDHSDMLCADSLRGKLTHRCFFTGASTRRFVQQGDADYVPIFLSDIPKLFRSGAQPVDTALIQVSPPDRHGMCTLGVSVEATKAACDVAGKIIAQINPRMPRTHGDAFIAYDRLHTVWECESEIARHAPVEQNAVTQKIGEHIASLVRDGDCLQMGIGAIPDAALGYLHNHRDLGVHTEMFADGLLPLIAKGVVNNRCKRKHPGKIVTTFAMGTQALYDFVDDNPQVVFLDVAYVNDTSVIRQNKGVVAINSALQVDLSGQICADSMGTKIYSGVGGQMDFMRGAALSENGRAIIALPATAAHGSCSRICSTLTPGAGVTTTRAHAQYLITEYGIANLQGRSLRERARDLIDIAAPEFRESLAREFYRDWGLVV